MRFHGISKKSQLNLQGLLKLLIIFLLPQLCRAFDNFEGGDHNQSESEAIHPQPPDELQGNEHLPKLLIILIDGFRWDYYSRQKGLPGLSRFMSEGVHAKWVDPIFPSLSYPSWTTIATGLYPEEHNIIGNFIIANNNNSGGLNETIFQLKDNSTKMPFWWQSAEPIWTTVTKNKRKVYLANWARCDVPFEDILPSECTGYTYQDVNLGFRNELQTGLKRLRNGYSLSMVYDDFIDHVGHKFGPDSKELEIAMIQRDAHIHELILNIQLLGLSNKINVVLTSDHGMTSLKNVTRIYLSDYINGDDVNRVVDYGAVVSISAAPNRTESLAQSLAKIPGVTFYPKSEIPSDFHYRNGKYVLDFLLVSHPGFYIVGLKGDKQVPNDGKSSNPNAYKGVHGFHNMTDMKTIFLAKGPAFKQGTTISPISLVDQYQIFMKVLELEALPNHGKWENVENMFSS